MLQNNLEANQAKLKKGLSPTPLNPVVDGAYLGTSRMLAPAGGAIISEAMDHLAPSMVDITLGGGIEVGGANKDLSDVAIDFSFSAATNKVKSANIPNMKISGNSAIKNIKDRVIDYTSSKIRNLPSPSTRPSVGRRSSVRETNTKVQDNTRVRRNEPKF